MSSNTLLPTAGFVLAGGRSSRMGTNKAFLEIGGQTLLARALSVVSSACGSATIIGDPATFSEFGSVLPDTFPGCGPLGGIHAALSHSRAQLNFILAVDMPFVSVDLIRFLMAKAAKNSAIVTVPRSQSRLQPLCAVYRREFGDHAERSIRAGHYKINPLFQTIPVHVIDEQELSAAGFSERNFINVNTPEDCRSASKDFMRSKE